MSLRMACAPRSRICSRVPLSRCITSTARLGSTRPVTRLLDWDLLTFREQAFYPQKPALLPGDGAALPPAADRWFEYGDSSNPDQNGAKLRYEQWQAHGDVIVPLELTTASPDTKEPAFQRFQAPLEIFLKWMMHESCDMPQQLYLAQCQLSDLPQSFRADLPTPELVTKAGKGDIYDTNIWVGKAPTYTPLHRDPNPNLFMQLAGQKQVRLFPPDVGASIFAAVQETLGRSASAVFRGEEMMQGQEKVFLEHEVWQTPHGTGGLQRECYEAELNPGAALFIPLGWWHSVKGVGTGVTASVNWWFR